MTPDDNPTLAQFVSWWLPRRRVRGRPLAPRTTAYYRVLLRVHILPTFGDVRLTDFKRVDVRTAPGTTRCRTSAVRRRRPGATGCCAGCSPARSRRG